MKKSGIFNLVKVWMVLLGFSGFAASKRINITGSTTVLPIAQREAEAFMDLYPDISVSVRGGGSGVGITALIDGRTDIANSSRAIQTKELKIAREKGVNVYANVIARDGIAIVVNPKNPIDSITLEDLKKIYTGEISNWEALGGPSKPIVVISRDFSSGTFEVFKDLVLKGGKVKDDALMLASNKAVATTVAETPDAIGYIGLGYISEEVKVLKIDGVFPNKETVQSGKYKLSRALFMYTNGEPKGIIKTFINFVLSREGQRIVEEEGFVPVK
ncbi:MAG: phosphate ABC transporter substrate-binding protein [candidate division WOR-3 bacterium]